MAAFLSEERFNFISPENKVFIYAFDDEMAKFGYHFGAKIGSGYCWGKYMLIYTKAGVKSKKVYARIYIREQSVVLRLFLSEIDKHRAFIEQAPLYVKEVFTGEYGKCKHCHNEKDGACMFRKTYTIDEQFIEKCNGLTFEFQNPGIDKVQDYIDLFTEFYPKRN